MSHHILKKVALFAPVLIAIFGWAVLAFPTPTLAATSASPDQQTVFDQKICPDLLKIKGQKLGKYCKDYTTQKDLDNAEKKICGKYGKNQLKSDCQAYATAGKAAGSGQTCAPGDATCSVCGANPNASGCPCANNACSDNSVVCNSDNCDLIQKYINPAIDAFSVTFGLIVAGSLILGGINYASSEGDPQKASQAKNRISKTVVAFIAYLFLYSFLQFIIPGGAFNR